MRETREEARERRAAEFAAERQAAIERIVAEAPPLSAGQIAVLVRIFGDPPPRSES